MAAYGSRAAFACPECVATYSTVVWTVRSPASVGRRDGQPVLMLDAAERTRRLSSLVGSLQL